MQGDLTQQSTYQDIYDRMHKIEARWHTINRLVYCAVSSDFFCTITTNLVKADIIAYQEASTSTQPWHRIVYEKPFGKDLHSAQEINRCIASHVAEHQLFRIDHYLTKDIVHNIALIRFANILFEPLWNSAYVDHVTINLYEELPVQGRGQYYDTYGALRDVVQNHMLQLLALIAMEPPDKLTGDYIRDKKADILKQLVYVDGIFGQYEGYQQEVDNPH